MSEEDKFDGLFLTLAQQCQGIDPMLESLFSFLRRKTDFFSGASAEKIEETVVAAIRKQATIAIHDSKQKKIAEEARKRAISAQKEQRKDVDPVIVADSEGIFDTSSLPNIKAETPATQRDSSEIISESDEKCDDSELKPEGNGGKTDRYSWTQTLGELSVSIPLPAGTKSRDILCSISRQHLKAGLKGQIPIVDGLLHKKVVVDDSFWTVEDGCELSIALQKDNKMEWWKCVIQGDAEIDTTKIQPENSKLNDLDADTRKTVEKMMFDQRQKAMGLPTADEMQKKDLLKKFMDQHPEMDFSNAKFN